LQRLVWTGKVPFEIQEMRAQSDGFELKFTQPVDSKTASDVMAYQLDSYTFLYRQDYGSDEVQSQRLSIRKATVSEDGYTVRLLVDGLRPLFVHELNALGVRNQDGHPLLHPQAYYTLNQIPK
jgi:hypothetical protein